jgi:ABC-type multidrug transport system ATPase subunit
MTKPAAVMLKVTEVGKVLGPRRVLDGVSFEVRQADVVVVRGENGSGKSTLLRVVCGVLAPDRGDVVIAGHSMRRDDVRAKSNMGYVPDATDALPELLVHEFIDLVRVLKGNAKGPAPLPGEALIARIGLRAFEGQSIGGLSFGQRKRMCLVAALCGDPPLLVLDEPSNGLDPEGVELVLAIIDERQKSQRATLLSTNDASFAERIGGTHYRLAHGSLSRA